MASSIFRSPGTSDDEDDIYDARSPLIAAQPVIGRTNQTKGGGYRGASTVYDNFGSKQRTSSFGLHPYVPLPSVFDDESTDRLNMMILIHDNIPFIE